MKHVNKSTNKEVNVAFNKELQYWVEEYHVFESSEYVHNKLMFVPEQIRNN
jgi:hypothetical protein